MVILYDQENSQEIEKIIKSIDKLGLIHALSTADPFNLAFEMASEEMIQSNAR